MISKQLLAVAMLAIGTQAVQFEKPTASLLAQQTDKTTTTLNDTDTATTVDTTNEGEDPGHFKYVEADWNKPEPNLEAAGIDDVDLERRRCRYCPWRPTDCCFRNIGCIDTNWDQEVMRNSCPPRGFCAYPGKFRCKHCKKYYRPHHGKCGCAQSEESEYADDYQFAEVDEDGYPVENCYAEDCGCEGDY